MFIGITGPRCSGKSTIAQYLVDNLGFRLLSITRDATADPQSPVDAMTFQSSSELETFVAEHWQENFVSADIDGETIEVLRKRPYFLLVFVEAPTSLRYVRYTQRSHNGGQHCQTLNEFVLEDDADIFGVALSKNSKRSVPLYKFKSAADIVVTNTYTNLCSFYEAIAEYNLTNPERLRPSWDTYFMHLSDLAARRSNCMKRRVGCILVKDYRVMATGYNGTPRGLRNCNEGGCERCNGNARCGTDLDRCLCMHAEENALLEAGRSRFDAGSGTVLYCNTCPCLGCAIKIVQTGVKEVVYKNSYGMDEMTAKIFAEANVKLRQHSPPGMHMEMHTSLTALESLNV